MKKIMESRQRPDYDKLMNWTIGQDSDMKKSFSMANRYDSLKPDYESMRKSYQRDVGFSREGYTQGRMRNSRAISGGYRKQYYDYWLLTFILIIEYILKNNTILHPYLSFFCLLKA